MKRFLLLTMAAGLLATSASAITVVGGTGGSATGTFQNFTASTSGTPYFSNGSADYPVTGGNIGYYMTNSGAYTGSPAGALDSPSQFYGNGNSSTPFSFLKQSSVLSITAMFAMADYNPHNEFGLYDVANTAIRQVIYSSGTIPASATSPNLPPTGVPTSLGNFGLYMVVCADSNAACGGTPITYYSGLLASSGADANHQHFALFQVAQGLTTQYYIGFDDTPGSSVQEGPGDYNDLIIRLTAVDSAVPEPATLSLVGFALLGVGFARRKFAKK